ncbi:hypothetical protein A6302_01841 [Methylobrevis pamukkalensis]|uniref:Transmembrane protein (PGPGW) n=1 Tax=Methylobrevis pamukkalensis TaxID=1439726 RepID=A0A1E3H3I7_9HYPH|nr:hypothetical protein A6302_01841 [Methylobrevis pamukkalensis]
MTRKIRIAGHQMPVPQSPALRYALGLGLVAGGTLGFLPVLGFWMVPLGLAVLSVDSPFVRRLRRRGEVAILRRWRGARSGKTADEAAGPVGPEQPGISKAAPAVAALARDGETSDGQGVPPHR